MSKLIESIKEIRSHGDGSAIAEIYERKTRKKLPRARITEFFEGRNVNDDVYDAILTFYAAKRKALRRKGIEKKIAEIIK